jgi:hypothetical protein
MNKLELSLNKGCVVVLAPQAARSQMIELAAVLSIRGALRVLDGGNQFNVYRLAQAVRRLTPQVKTALGRVEMSRAFTCYQMLSLLVETEAGGAPVVVLDLLATFYDEDISLAESRKLLRQALLELRRLSQEGIVLVGARQPPAACFQRVCLLEMVKKSAGQLFAFDSQPPAPKKISGLFE